MSYARQGNLFGTPIGTMTPKGHRAIAFHEAGHAVALEITGGQVEEVRCEFHHPIPVHHVQGAGWTPEARLAGIVAEKWAEAGWVHPVGCSPRQLRMYGWGDDVEQWRRATGRRKPLRAALEETERLLAPYSGKVAGLAGILVETEVVEGDTVRRLVLEVDS
jgi:hypothetical protein